MFRLRELVDAHRARHRAALTSQHGKVLSDAMGEVARGLENIEFACGVPNLLKGGFSEQVSTGVDVYSIRQPLGVVAGITPFNFPAMVPMWMFANAIACGNTFVLKPSEKDPGASLYLAELLKRGRASRRRVQRRAGRQGGGRRAPRAPRRRRGELRRLDADRAVHLRDRHAQRQAGAGARRREEPHGRAARRRHRHGGRRGGLAPATARPASGAWRSRWSSRSATWPIRSSTRSASGCPKVKVGAGQRPRVRDGPARHRASIATRWRATSTPRRRRARRSSSTAGSTPLSERRRLLPGRLAHRRRHARRWTATRTRSSGRCSSVVRASTLRRGARPRERQPVRQRRRDLHAGRRRGAAVPVRRERRHGRRERARSRYRSRTTRFGGWKASLFGDQHMYGPDGINFYTRQKVVTARWPDPGTSRRRPRLPEDAMSGTTRSAPRTRKRPAWSALWTQVERVPAGDRTRPRRGRRLVRAGHGLALRPMGGLLRRAPGLMRAGTFTDPFASEPDEILGSREPGHRRPEQGDDVGTTSRRARVKPLASGSERRSPRCPTWTTWPRRWFAERDVPRTTTSMRSTSRRSPTRFPTERRYRRHPSRPYPGSHRSRGALICRPTAARRTDSAKTRARGAPGPRSKAATTRASRSTTRTRTHLVGRLGLRRPDRGVAEPGDYIVRDIAGESIFVVAERRRASSAASTTCAATAGRSSWTTSRGRPRPQGVRVPLPRLDVRPRRAADRHAERQGGRALRPGRVSAARRRGRQLRRASSS